jgi:hypothetical protein
MDNYIRNAKNKFALYAIVDFKFLFNLDKGHHGS